MADADSFSRLSRLALAGAIVIAVASVGYRVARDRATAAAAAAAQQAEVTKAAEQRQQIESMLTLLEEKLKAEPNRPEGWLLLIRGRLSLGQVDRARAALDAAVKANPAQAAEIRAQAEAFGLR